DRHQIRKKRLQADRTARTQVPRDPRRGAVITRGHPSRTRLERVEQRRLSFALRLLDAHIKWRTHHEALELRFHHPVCAARTRQAKLITSMRAQPSPPGSTFGRLNPTRSASTSTFETSHPAGEARHRMVTVDPATAEKAAQLAFDDPANHIRSQSSPSA